MSNSWMNTCEALKSFTSLLRCEQCELKAINPVRYSNCGHLLCNQCVNKTSNCGVCQVPIHSNQVHPDHIVADLLNCCDIVAQIIQADKLWDLETLQTLDKSAGALSQLSRSNKSITLSKHVIKNINKPNCKGETRLHKACVQRQAGHVKLLLAAGANPNTKDYANWTPLQEVVNLGYLEICEILLEASALPDVPGIENRTALHEAVIHNRIDEAKLLLRYQANLNVNDQYGKKPIDYCDSAEMYQILAEFNLDQDRTNETLMELNHTMDQSMSIANSQIVVLASNLTEDHRKLLSVVSAKHKIKVVTSFKPSVTHVVVEANTQNITNLTYDVMLAILQGKWLLNSEWILLASEMKDISEMEPEIFAISGAPVVGVPKLSRENAEKQNPRLFNKCYFYFALNAKNIYNVGDLKLSKENLIKLATAGEGIVLTREPDPEDIKCIVERPFHVAQNPSHPLHRCTHYIIYVPEKNEPRVKYNMPHIKTLPLIWFIECIEKFTLIDPSHFGLS